MARVIEKVLKQVEANRRQWAKEEKKETAWRQRIEAMEQNSFQELATLAKARDFWALASSNKVTPDGAMRLSRWLDEFRQAEMWRIRLVAIKKSARALKVFEEQCEQVLKHGSYGPLAALGGPCARDTPALDREFLDWWIKTLGQLKPFLLAHAAEPATDADGFEAQCLRWLLELATDGRGGNPASILKFRHCDRCDKWFWTLAPHQRFCSSRCRVAFFASKPDSKKARAERVRRVRTIDKLRDEYFKKHKEKPTMSTVTRWEREYEREQARNQERERHQARKIPQHQTAKKETIQ